VKTYVLYIVIVLHSEVLRGVERVKTLRMEGHLPAQAYEEGSVPALLADPLHLGLPGKVVSTFKPDRLHEGHVADLQVSPCCLVEYPAWQRPNSEGQQSPWPKQAS